MFAIVNKEKKYLTKANLNADFSFTDNKNLAYVLSSHEEVSQLKSFAEKYLEQKLDIVTLKE